MDIFTKGDYRPIPPEFRTLGVVALGELTKFQEHFLIYDTDTTINSIRDAIVANYLRFDLLNFGKHGFDAKRSTENAFLEVKQCSLSARRLGGTWNDTNEEKALAFSDPRLSTTVAVWKGASDLQFMVYGHHPELGRFLHERVTHRKSGSRSTQTIGIETLIIRYGFSVVIPPDKEPTAIIALLVNYQRNLASYVSPKTVKTISDI